MSGIQKQIVDLNGKVDQLHNVVERLSQQITILASVPQESLSPNKENEPIEIEIIEPMISSDSLRDVSCSAVIDHQDVLTEQSKKYKTYNSFYSENNISPELQIRRLTAQLTAAYNRIAVLEEQLVGRRIHSSGF